MREMPYIQPYHVGNRRGGNQNILDEFREFLDARGGRGGRGGRGCLLYTSPSPRD